MMSRLKRCDDGLLPERLLSLKCSEENDSTQIQMYTEPLTSNSHKRPRNINEVTSNDRLQISNSTTQNTKSSATLAQGSTGNTGGLLPFWNEYTQEESKKWWLPERFEFNYLFALIYCFYFANFFIRTDCDVLDLSLWNGSLRRMGLSS